MSATVTTTTASPLVSAVHSNDSSLRALVHPLVLLTISDYITRHTLRRQTQPIVGVLLGQQNGREVSVEHGYEAKVLAPAGAGGDWRVDEAWFDERLRQYKEVHKEPPLELVGWWTLCPVGGPTPEMLPVHRFVMHAYNESLLLLAFHPAAVAAGPGSLAPGGKLPLTIYESAYESARDDKAMQIDGEAGKGEEGPEVRFRELAYEIVTGEAEMIGIDFVARGGGNATVGDKRDGPEGSKDGKDKGKGTKKGGREDAVADVEMLSAEEEELLASLTTRANAIKMLHSRLTLLQTYLTSLPPSYLTSPTSPTAPTTPPPAPLTSLSHPLLRSILALTARLALLIPADDAAFQHEAEAERSDVALVALLGGMAQSVQGCKELGARFGVVEGLRAGSRKEDRRGWEDTVGGEGAEGAWGDMLRGG